MHSYRLLIFGKDGKLIGPALPILAEDDAAALAEAEKRVDGSDAELRDRFRRVKKITPKPMTQAGSRRHC